MPLPPAQSPMETADVWHTYRWSRQAKGQGRFNNEIQAMVSAGSRQGGWSRGYHGHKLTPGNSAPSFTTHSLRTLVKMELVNEFWDINIFSKFQESLFWTEAFPINEIVKFTSRAFGLKNLLDLNYIFRTRHQSRIPRFAGEVGLSIRGFRRGFAEREEDGACNRWDSFVE